MGTCCEGFGKHWIVFSFMQCFAWLPQGRPQGKQKLKAGVRKNGDFFAARRVCIARTMPWQDVRPSIRLPVCLSHGGIVPKRLHISSSLTVKLTATPLFKLSSVPCVVYSYIVQLMLHCSLLWTSCLRFLTKSPAIPRQLYKTASPGLSARAELLVYVIDSKE